jgi:hypothetical protein
LVHVVIIQWVGVSVNIVFFIEIVGTNPIILFDDKENCHKENNKNGPLRMLTSYSRMLLKWMMITDGSDGMILSFLCPMLLSRQTVMFAIHPLVQEKYPMSVKILGYLARGSGKQMQIALVSYPDSLVLALVCMFIYYNIYNRLTTGDLRSPMQMLPNVLQNVQGGLW